VKKKRYKQPKRENIVEMIPEVAKFCGKKKKIKIEEGSRLGISGRRPVKTKRSTAPRRSVEQKRKVTGSEKLHAKNSGGGGAVHLGRGQNTR